MTPSEKHREIADNIVNESYAPRSTRADEIAEITAAIDQADAEGYDGGAMSLRRRVHESNVQG